MTDEDLEKSLRSALRPVEPPPGFASRVMTRVEAGAQPSSRRWRPRLWLPVALAASAIFAVLVVHEHHKREEGLQARQQLIDALRVTGEKLDLAYRAVNAS